MDDRAFWTSRCFFTGDQLALMEGGDPANWRKRIRRAKEKYPDLPWRSTEKVLHGIAVYDLHYPLHEERLWDNLLSYMADSDIDIFIFGGDNLDCTPVSHWLENKRRSLEAKRLIADYEGFNKDIIQPLRAVLPPSARKVFLKGNHEDWVNQYLDKHPEVEGLIEMERHLDLDGWEVYEYGENLVIGRMVFIHGVYTNLHNAYKTTQVYGHNVFYGHGHSFQAMTMTTPLDAHPHMGMQVPCACHKNPEYAKNRPNSWVNGFLDFYIRSDGNFAAFPVIALDGSFVAPNGKWYK